ncbi:hypothetical protein GCM10028806_05430 [Spirosoma terrae]|uniref:NUMOD4 domain-containing protein n=1 Tax=Spirosoma terrae TaxID=1968276 RepID=A0A6L9L8D9_9BACT|nr:NUMOD4 domain-containing protein [Spirosoma terrae]NDU96876.1 hypothetical protein [Spirosoma terrae]
MSTEQSYVGRGNFATTPPPTAQNAASHQSTADDRLSSIHVNPLTGQPNEVWKPLAGFETQYRISNLGNVWSNADRDYVKTWPNKDGDHCFIVRSGQKRISATIRVHRAVAEAFLPNPNGYDWVRRKVKDGKRNEVTNLRWEPSPRFNAKNRSATQATSTETKPLVPESDPEELLAEIPALLTIHDRTAGSKHRPAAVSILHIDIWYRNGLKGEINLTSPNLISGEFVEMQYFYMKQYFNKVGQWMELEAYQASICFPRPDGTINTVGVFDKVIFSPEKAYRTNQYCGCDTQKGGADVQ